MAQTDAVNLNEITSVKGDAQNSFGSAPEGGGTDVVLAFNPGIQYLSLAAKAKADANQFKYNEFQKNLKDFYTNFNEMKVDGIMEKDYPVVNEEYASLARDLAANYDVIRNPMKDPEKFAQLKQREAELRGKISRSKQDVAYREANNKFIQTHPEFNTSDNTAAINDFQNKPIGERQLFTLNTPFVYDPTERSKVANQVAQQKLKDEQIKGKYITSSESVKYLEDEYDRAWDALGTVQDKSGRTVSQQAQNAYSKLDPSLTNGKSFQDLDRQVGRSLLYQTDEMKTLRPNQVELQEDEQKFGAWQSSLNRGLQRELSADKELDGAGRDYNEALTTGFTRGYVRPELLQGLFGDSSEIESTNKKQRPVLDTKTGQPIPGLFEPTGEEVKTKVAKIQVTGAALDANGKLVVKRIDNSNGGAALPDISMTFDDAREAFKNIAGTKNAGKVADAAENYRKKNNLGLNPELEKLQKHFDFNTQADTDLTLTDAEYFKKFKKAKPKK